MFDYQKHLEFLQAASQLPAERCKQVFEQLKKDVRPALVALLADELPDKTALWAQCQSDGDDAARAAHLSQYFRHFAPNDRFSEILLQLQQRKLYPLDTYSVTRLGQYRLPPNRDEVAALFGLLDAQWPLTVQAFFRGIRPFGLEVQARIGVFQQYTQHPHAEVAVAAIEALPFLPDGVDRSLMLLWGHLRKPALRISVLKVLYRANYISPELLYSMFQPFLQEYERLRRNDGTRNALYEEALLMRDVLRKHGGSGRVFMFDLDSEV